MITTHDRAAATRTSIVLVGLTALVAQLLVVSSRDVLILEWRPTELASIALNYYRHGFDFLHPQIFWGGNGSGYVEMEFPLLPYTIAWLYRWFGIHDWLALLPTFVCGIALPIVILRFTTYLFTPTAGLIAGVLTATSPSWVAMSTGLWPDPPPLLFAAAGLYLLTKWVDNDSIAHFALAAFALTLSILLKLTSLYVGIPVLFLFWTKYHSGWWRMPSAWLFAALVLIPPALWYSHAYRLFLETGNTFGILASGYSKLGSVDLYLDPRFYLKTIARVGVFDVTLLGCALAALATTTPVERQPQRIAFVWTAAVVLYCIVAAEGVSLGHYQYALPIVPPSAMLAGVGFENLRRSRWLPVLTVGSTAAVLLVLNAVAANYLFQTRGMNFRHLSEQKMRTGKALARLTPPDSLIVVIDGNMDDRTPQTSMTPPEVFYFADRRGWYRSMAWLTSTTIPDLQAQGARFVAVSANNVRLFRARHQDFYRQWSQQYATMIDDDDGIIYDLGAPAASLNTR